MLFSGKETVPFLTDISMSSRNEMIAIEKFHQFRKKTYIFLAEGNSINKAMNKVKWDEFCRSREKLTSFLGRCSFILKKDRKQLHPYR